MTKKNKLWRKILGYQVGERVRIRAFPKKVWTITEVELVNGIRLYTVETKDGDFMYISDEDILEE